MLLVEDEEMGRKVIEVTELQGTSQVCAWLRNFNVLARQ